MRRHHRSGFTLVELLVSVALIVFVMIILSEAFAVSMQSFRLLKAVGDMDAKLRTATTALREDLSADHFEGKRRISDPNFWSEGPPREGFFRIWHGSDLKLSPADVRAEVNGNYFLEGNDSASRDRINSRRAVDHYLHFTVKKRGNNPADVYSARLPGKPPYVSPLWGLSTTFFNQANDARYQEGSTTEVFTSQWAEVAYFLRPSLRPGGVMTNAADWTLANGTPLYSLHRRQRLVIPNNLSALTVPNSPDRYAEHAHISCYRNAANLTFNNPTDLTIPQNRFAMSGIVPGATIAKPIGTSITYPAYPSVEADTGDPTLVGTDLILNDVITFEVRVLVPSVLLSATDPDFVSLHSLACDNPSINTQQYRMFDTWTNQKVAGYPDYTQSLAPAPFTGISVPVRQRILALQITLRVWDFKTEQTRQVTIIQDM